MSGLFDTVLPCVAKVQNAPKHIAAVQKCESPTHAPGFADNIEDSVENRVRVIQAVGTFDLQRVQAQGGHGTFN